MKLISTKVHGILDYLVALLLIIAPMLFGFNQGGAETWIPVILGISTIIYSLFTQYEYGVADIIPMRIHLLIDFVSGLFLAVSPWVFNFDDTVFLPHLIFGI